MGYIEEIYELLQKEDLTIDQLSGRIQIKPNPEDNKNNIRVYINRLIERDHLIEIIGKEGRSRIYRAIKSNSNLEIQLLKKFIPIFLENDLDIDLTDQEFNRIKELYEEVSK